MNNPDNALWLYVLVLVCAFLLSPRWGMLRSALTTAGSATQTSLDQGQVTPGSAATTGSTVTHANGTTP